MYIIQLINRISNKGQYLRDKIPIYYPDCWLGPIETARIFRNHNEAVEALHHLSWVGDIGDHYIIVDRELESKAA